MEHYLDSQGLDFKPLRQEMLDHFLSDIEYYEQQGHTQQEAWNIIKKDIPEHHFTQIQNETMEAIKKRFNWATGLTYLSLALLLASSIFKILHLQGAGMLLLFAFATMALSFLVGTVSGIYLHKDKKGRALSLGVVLGITLFLLSWSFQILHLPGFFELRVTSIVCLVIIFPIITQHFTQQGASEDNILFYLHQKYRPGIERFLLILLTFGLVMWLSQFGVGENPGAFVISVVVIYGAGLHFFALNWYDIQLRSKVYKLLLVVGFFAFILPIAAIFPPTVRVGVAAVFYLIGIVLCLYNTSKTDFISYGMLTVTAVYVLLWSLIAMGALPEGMYKVIFNLPLLAIFLVGLILVRKKPITRTFLIIVIAHYLISFPQSLELF